MKFTKSTVLFFTIGLFLISGISFSQVTITTSRLKPAAVIVEMVFDYNQPLPSMYGDMADFFTFKNYGVKVGTGAHFNVKLTADKKGKIRPYFTIGYDLFLNSDK